MLAGWNTELAQDIAVYQGSTTGQKNGDETCRGTGGMVTWQVDRGCHKISAKSFDKMCKAMLQQKDDMKGDVVPHNARITTGDFITTDVPMAEGVTAQELGHRALAAKQERLGFRWHQTSFTPHSHLIHTSFTPHSHLIHTALTGRSASASAATTTTRPTPSSPRRTSGSTATSR